MNKKKVKCDSFVLEKNIVKKNTQIKMRIAAVPSLCLTELECNVNTRLRRYRLDSRPVTIKRNKNDLEIFLLLFTSFLADVLAVHSH